MSKPFLSIIIPAHNEENRLPDTLAQVVQFLQSQPYTSEVLVVENASRDNTRKIAGDFAAQNPDNPGYSPRPARQGPRRANRHAGRPR
jgi:dolichyl-phosphate beta-glucosyltransferase